MCARWRPSTAPRTGRNGLGADGSAARRRASDPHRDSHPSQSHRVSRTETWPGSNARCTIPTRSCRTTAGSSDDRMSGDVPATLRPGPEPRRSHPGRWVSRLVTLSERPMRTVRSDATSWRVELTDHPRGGPTWWTGPEMPRHRSPRRTCRSGIRPPSAPEDRGDVRDHGARPRSGRDALPPRRRDRGNGGCQGRR